VTLTPPDVVYDDAVTEVKVGAEYENTVTPETKLVSPLATTVMGIWVP
jgi:hypothetical protein